VCAPISYFPYEYKCVCVCVCACVRACAYTHVRTHLRALARLAVLHAPSVTLTVCVPSSCSLDPLMPIGTRE